MTRSEQKRSDILTAAREEFIQYGFVIANIDRICINAKVSKRTLYRHFSSKERLFESVLSSIQSKINEQRYYPFDINVSLHQQLKKITLNELDILYQKYGLPLSRVIVMEFVRCPEIARNFISKFYSNKAVTQWFALAMKAKKIKENDLNLLTTFYFSLFQGLFFWPQLIEMRDIFQGDKLDTCIEQFVGLILDGILIEQ